MTTNAPKLNTNLDTDLIKLVAILSMVADHVGSAFFPQYPVFRWLGRLAFPLFYYCLTVGLGRAADYHYGKGAASAVGI